jgi:uncharacterized protein (UPF0333 family)
MSIKPVLNNKKAISTTLSTLLLVVVAVASLVVTYVWVTTYLGTTTQQAEVLLYKENVRFDTTSVIITVGNQGTGNTVITRIYLGTSSTDMQDVTANSTISGSGALAAGSTCTVTITLPTAGLFTWTSGTIYYFRIIPNPGQFLEFQQDYA